MTMHLTSYYLGLCWLLVSYHCCHPSTTGHRLSWGSWGLFLWHLAAAALFSWPELSGSPLQLQLLRTLLARWRGAYNLLLLSVFPFHFMYLDWKSKRAQSRQAVPVYVCSVAWCGGDAATALPRYSLARFARKPVLVDASADLVLEHKGCCGNLIV